MNYQTILDTALAYADREDDEVIVRMDSFLRMVESRINRRLRVGKAAKRAVVASNSNDEYFGLPYDFDGMRDIEIHGELIPRDTPRYVSPEVMNRYISEDRGESVYTLIADQLQIHPLPDGSQVEIVYYSRLPEMSASIPTTWLSDRGPDVYVFGLLVEISAFVKDAEAGLMWNSRFTDELNQVQTMDGIDRWSGPALQIQLG